MQSEAILFDAMGTLITLERAAPALCRELATQCGIEVALEHAEHALTEEISYYRAHLDEGRDPESLEALRGRCAMVVRDALPPLDGLDLDLLRDVLMASLRFRPYPEVPSALLSLRKCGHRLVVVSNWDISLHDVLARLELAPLLDGVVTSAEVGERKPAPAIFMRALEVAGVEAADATHVGDSLDEDVLGAQAAGIEAVLISRIRTVPVTDARMIMSLDEL